MTGSTSATAQLMPHSPFDSTPALEAISLDELNGVAALQSRVDRKYLLDNDALQRLVGGLANGARLLEIDGQSQFDYSSVYFDTPDHALYLAAAYGRRRRFKVRTRHYEDSGLCLLEVKQKAQGRTVKTRLPYEAADRQRLTSPGLTYVSSVTEQPGICDRLQPVLTTRYRRQTLVDLQSRTRLTIDTDLRCTSDTSATASLNMAVVETKTAGAAGPADRLLWSLGIRPVRISKFGTALAALNPHLPSNRWHRAVNVGWQTS
ncbi:MAG: polyphosphate polymerase domain-containing protein [Acidimicrobiales bacterium]